MSITDIDHIPCARVKRGSLLVIDSRPCKVMNETTSKTGKHGHAKKIITAVDIFNEKKYVTTYSTADTLDAPIVKTVEYQLLSVEDDGYLDLLDDLGNQIGEFRTPDNVLGKTIRHKYDDGENLNIIIKSALGINMVADYKIDKS